jgi:hypothetical protein
MIHTNIHHHYYCISSINGLGLWCLEPLTYFIINCCIVSINVYRSKLKDMKYLQSVRSPSLNHILLICFTKWLQKYYFQTSYQNTKQNRTRDVNVQFMFCRLEMIFFYLNEFKSLDTKVRTYKTQESF